MKMTLTPFIMGGLFKFCRLLITHQIRQKKRENIRFRRTVEGLIKSLINQAT